MADVEKRASVSRPPQFDGKRLAFVWSGLAQRRGGFTCSQAAVATQKVTGGVVSGYWAKDNPTAVLGRDEGGHDFVVIEDRYLLDFWASAYYETNPVLDLTEDAVEVLRLYGPRDKWAVVEP